MTSTITLTFNLDTKKGRITDSTDFAALGIVPSTLNAKGLGTVYFNGEILVQKLTVGDPLINLASGSTYFEFDLELDSLGDVANGTYQVDYSTRFAISQPAQVDFSVVSSNELLTDGGSYLVNVLEAGNEITLEGGGTATIASVTSSSTNVLIELEGTPLTTEGYFNFDVTNETFTDTYTYSGCVKITASAASTFDCDSGDNGTFTFYDNTDLSTVTLVSRSMVGSPPQWATEISAVTTANSSYTINRLATGTWSVVLTDVVTDTQTDGLILQYTITDTIAPVVTCAGTLCGLNACIENLRAAHYAALSASAVSPYQKYVDDVALYYIKAVSYKQCGEIANYQEQIALLEASLDASGCECSCCDDNEFKYIYNTSSTTQAQIDVIEENVNNLMTVNYNKVLFESPVIILDNPSDYITPPTGPFLTFDDVSAITIPKSYFDADPNGVAKKGVLIEMTTYSSNERTPYIQGPIGRVYDTPSVTGDNTTVRHEIRLSTAKVSTLTVCVSLGESFQIDNAGAANVLDSYASVNNYGELWDLSEDLVLEFNISGGTTGNAITKLRISAYSYE